MRTLPMRGAAIALALFTAACGGTTGRSSPPGEGGPSARAASGTAEAYVPNPLDVAVTLEADGSQSGVIGSDGGEVTAVAADGLTFTLVIPADALTGERQITLTPVAAISGSPLGGAPLGVQMEPDGLQLLESATLRIEGGPTIDPDELAGFEYSGNGTDFHLVPVGVDGSAFVLRISHFSGAGVWEMTRLERAEQQARAPVEYHKYVEQELAILLNRELSACWVGLCEDPDFTTMTAEDDAFVKELLEGWWQLVEETVRAGETDCAAFQRGSSQLQAWERERELLGESQPDPRLKTLGPSLHRGEENCLYEAYEKCRSNHDLGQATVMFEYLQTSEYVGGDTGIEELAEDLAGKCTTLEIEYEAQVVYSPGVGSYAVQATFPLKAEVKFTGNPTLQGSGPLEVTASDGWLDGWVAEGECRDNITGPAGDQPFRVEEVEWTWSAPDPAGGRTVTGLVLTADPGSLNHTVTLQCPEVEPLRVDYGVLYHSGWVYLHRTGASDQAVVRSITFTSDEILGGELFALKEYSRSVTESGVSVEGDFVFRLWHRPPAVTPPGS